MTCYDSILLNLSLLYSISGEFITLEGASEIRTELQITACIIKQTATNSIRTLYPLILQLDKPICYPIE